MLIGIISDIHSNIYGLKAVLIKLQKTDIIICAGDITGYYTFVNEVFAELQNKQVQFIKGNFDNFLFTDYSKNKIIQESVNYTKNVITPENLELLKNTKTKLSLKIDSKQIKIFHGSPWKIDEYINPDYKNFKKFKSINADLIILGHTHKPMIKKINQTIIVNPGSCGQPRDYDGRASCAIYDTKTCEAKIFRIKYDYSPIIKAIASHNLDPKLIDNLKKTK